MCQRVLTVESPRDSGPVLSCHPRSGLRAKSPLSRACASLLNLLLARVVLLCAPATEPHSMQATHLVVVMSTGVYNALFILVPLPGNS